MPFIHDDILDLSLAGIDAQVENLYITTQEVVTYTEAITTYKCGVKATPTIGTPEAGAANGRRVIVAEVTDGTVECTGTVSATHWALTDNSESKLIATGALGASQDVTNGNTFTLTAFSVTLPDAA